MITLYENHRFTDSEFTCPKCGNRATLEYHEFPVGVYCDKCVVFDHRKPFLNQPPEDSVLSEAVKNGQIKMTEAKDQIIKNQIISPDDNKTVIDQRTGKEAEY